MSNTASRYAVWMILLAAAGTFALTMGTRQTMGLFLSDVNSATGLGIAAALYAVLTRNLAQTIADYHLVHSKPAGGGTNVVNVILVDFRGYDTFGEITVLGIAAIGVLALMEGMHARRPGADAEGRRWTFSQQPMLLRTAATVVLPLAKGVPVRPAYAPSALRFGKERTKASQTSTVASSAPIPFSRARPRIIVSASPDAASLARIASRACSSGPSKTAKACRCCTTAPAPSTSRTTTTSTPRKPARPASCSAAASAWPRW